MRIRFLLISILLILGLAVSVRAEIEDFPIATAGITRTISSVGNILKTTKIKANGLQMLDSPSVEFMIDLEYKGKQISLIPGDFDEKGLESVKQGSTNWFQVEMVSHYDGLPLTVRVNYYANPKAISQYKDLTILPLPGATLKRVTLEYLQFPYTYEALTLPPKEQGTAGQIFAARDPKTGKAIFFTSITAPQQKLQIDFGRGCLVAVQETDQPLDKGFQSGSLVLGALAGTPDAITKAFQGLTFERAVASRPKASK